MNDDEFRAMAIRRAMDGDAAAARDVLDLCREGLDNNCLHADLRVYLAERITEILDGVPPGDALLVTKKPGRPKESGAWRDQLGAFAVLLHRRGLHSRPRQLLDIGKPKAPRTVAVGLQGRLAKGKIKWQHSTGILPQKEQDGQDRRREKTSTGLTGFA